MIYIFKALNYCQLMYLKTFKICVLKYMSLTLCSFSLCTRVSIASSLKKLLTGISMLLLVEKGIRGRICHAIYRYAEAYNKYKKNYDKNKESSYLKHWDINILYGWTVPQNLPSNDFKWVTETSQFNEDFIKIYNKDSDITIFY